ncbi:PREDICTED: uncharacterized protein LOC109117024 [Tarenaya hassleriana]|uniref:uncharacterized protein LOC109117024 n=1 Tax=Tarenaya hassleriana TaxID=28532 RepID=UPI0008FD26F0|nr:PREDICTED: uncharacterized protein LOC109117024 [Tarenaya hassleriana]
MGEWGLYGRVAKKKERRRKREKRRGRGWVHVKVRKLQMLIPGGRELKADLLLSKTVEYILQLKLKIRLLKSLSDVYSL